MTEKLEFGTALRGVRASADGGCAVLIPPELPVSVQNARKWGAHVGRPLKVTLELVEWARRPADDLRRVILESPYGGDIERNVEYARACMLDCMQRGEAPFASHLLYTQCLDDSDPKSRALGIKSGFAFRRVASATIVYEDLGISRGMEAGIADAEAVGCPVERRRLGGKWSVRSGAKGETNG